MPESETFFVDAEEVIEESSIKKHEVQSPGLVQSSRLFNLENNDSVRLSTNTLQLPTFR
jgi:hypothetical protein